MKNSALHHIGFIEVEPDVIHLGTARNALRIRDSRITQHFYGTLDEAKHDSVYISKVSNALRRENIYTYTSKDYSNEIRLFNLSALFADLLRDHYLYPRQQLRELLVKFRDCKYFCDESLHFDVSPESIQFDFELLDLIEKTCLAAQLRKWMHDWDID